MNSTPHSFMAHLRGRIASGSLREDQPIFVAYLDRQDIETAAEWHNDLGECRRKIKELTDEDLKVIFTRLENHDGVGDLVEKLADAAADRCAELAKRDERYKLYLELQKEFNPAGAQNG